MATQSFQKKKPLAIIRCGGGQSAVMVDVIKDQYESLCIYDDRSFHSTFSKYVCALTKDEVIDVFAGLGDAVTNVDVYIGVGDPHARERLYSQMNQLCQEAKKVPTYPACIHKTAFVSDSATVGQGTFVGPFAVLHTNCSVGSFCIINTHAIIEHDCQIEEYVNVAPNACLCGTVTVKKYSNLGVSSTVREKSSIPESSIVGMHCGVTRSLEAPDSTWIGTPARPMMARPLPGPFVSLSGFYIPWVAKKPFSQDVFMRYLQPSLTIGHLTNNPPILQDVKNKIKSITKTTFDVHIACNGAAALNAIAGAYSLQRGRRQVFVSSSFNFPSAFQGCLSNTIIVDLVLHAFSTITITFAIPSFISP
jgi:acetyltransferase EpsM